MLYWVLQLRIKARMGMRSDSCALLTQVIAAVSPQKDPALGLEGSALQPRNPSRPQPQNLPIAKTCKLSPSNTSASAAERSLLQEPDLVKQANPR